MAVPLILLALLVALVHTSPAFPQQGGIGFADDDEGLGPHISSLQEPTHSILEFNEAGPFSFSPQIRQSEMSVITRLIFIPAQTSPVEMDPSTNFGSIMNDNSHETETNDHAFDNDDMNSPSSEDTEPETAEESGVSSEPEFMNPHEFQNQLTQYYLDRIIEEEDKDASDSRSSEEDSDISSLEEPENSGEDVPTIPAWIHKFLNIINKDSSKAAPFLPGVQDHDAEDGIYRPWWEKAAEIKK